MDKVQSGVDALDEIAGMRHGARWRRPVPTCSDDPCECDLCEVAWLANRALDKGDGESLWWMALAAAVVAGMLIVQHSDGDSNARWYYRRLFGA